MSANHGDPARGEFSDSELDIVLSAANEELLNYVQANANSRATLLRIMEIRDKDRYRPIRHDGAGRPMMLPQTDRAPLRRWDPEQIGPYVILGRLGCGAMGQVYLGRSAAGPLVAVKTIKIGLAEEADFRTRFALEVAAARRVSGAFTAAVVEADPEADVPWLATAYVPAPSLNQLVRACGPLPLRTVRWLAAGCAEALESIHSVGLVHGDLKPSNVLVAPDGPRVIDFGVARAAEPMEPATARGAVGTPAYMAPEQARDTRQASVAGDVYSLGVTLLFAATGHPPYDGATVMDVLARLATEEPDLSGLPAELTPLITACIQRVPRMRPTSSALVSWLGRFTEAQAGPAEEHSYLPEAAMALIAEYQRKPQFAVHGEPGEESSGEEPRVEDRSEDATHASYTELPASCIPSPRRRVGQRCVPLGDAGRGWRGRVAYLAWVGWAYVGAALIMVGVIFGAAHSSWSAPNSSQQQTTNPAAPPVAPPTVCGTSATNTGGGNGGPALCMLNQSMGTSAAAWIAQGRGFAPGTSVTVSLTWNSPPQLTPSATFHHTTLLKPVVAADGSLRLDISRLFPGPLRLGLFTVEVTGSDGSKVRTMFVVIPPGG